MDCDEAKCALRRNFLRNFEPLFSNGKNGEPMRLSVCDTSLIAPWWFMESGSHTQFVD